MNNPSKTEILSGAETQISPVAKTLNIDSMGVTLPVEDMGGVDPKSHITYSKNGKYDIVKEIGQGGMGKIFLWKDKDIQRLVATKMLLPERQQSLPCLQRFFEEGQITGQLEHPNIVPIHEMGVDDGALYFTMKYVKGQSLHDLISKITKDKNEREKWSTGKILRIFQSICHAIEYAHSKNVVHRDLKPDNIMLGNFGEVMVMDWGLAKVLGQGGEVFSEDSITTLREKGGFQTITGQITGTPLYMSPEQAKGEIDNIDKRSDVYALGTILYEMITGKRCVHGSSVFEIISKVAQGKLEQIPPKGLFGKIEKELAAIVNKCLATSAEERYQNVRELIEDVQLYLDRKEVSAYSYSIWEKIYNVIDGYRKEIILVVVTTLLLSVMFSYWTYYQNKLRSEEEIMLAEEELQNFANDLESFGISWEKEETVVRESEESVNFFPSQAIQSTEKEQRNSDMAEPSEAGNGDNVVINSMDDMDDDTGKTDSDDKEIINKNEVTGDTVANTQQFNPVIVDDEKTKESKVEFKQNARNDSKKKQEIENKEKFNKIKNAILKTTKKYKDAYEKLKLYNYRQKEAEAWWILYQAAEHVGDASYQEIARHQIQSLLNVEDLAKYEQKGLK